MWQLASGKTNLSSEQYKAADVDGDGEVTVKDAQLILRYYVINVSGMDMTWEAFFAFLFLSGSNGNLT